MSSLTEPSAAMDELPDDLDPDSAIGWPTGRPPGWPRWLASIMAGVGTSRRGSAERPQAIEQEVQRRVGPEIPPDLVGLAVRDALAGDRPRW